MIISASRRTDIPAFYAQWMINRIRAGFCTVPNPFNRRQVSRISLLPEDVDVIVFWTRNPAPLLPHLAELQRLHNFYFQFTLLGYPREIDPHSPSVPAAVAVFKELSERIGPDRVIWRYDPVVFTSLTDANFHRQNYRQLAGMLKQFTTRSIVSLMDRYRKAERRLKSLDTTLAAVESWTEEEVKSLLRHLANAARDNGMEIFSCAEEMDLTTCGIEPGKCIDDGLIAREFQTLVKSKKDPGQRDACGCVVSRDIGSYDSCLFGCQYCYATQSFERARKNFTQEHDPNSPSLLGWYEAPPEPLPEKPILFHP
jgi:DNA repair photolyase